MTSEKFRYVISDPYKKPLLRIGYEAFLFSLMKREAPVIYFGKMLYRKDVRNVLKYLGNKEMDKLVLSKKYHNQEYVSILRDKELFYQYLSKHQIPAPTVFAVYRNRTLFMGDQEIPISSAEELNTHFQAICHAQGVSHVFIKPLDGMGGKGCLKFQAGINSKEQIKHLDSLQDVSFLIQDLVIQHEFLNSFNADSINTLRFLSFLDDDSNVHIISSLIRFGRKGHAVDNASSGGFFVGIDLETGTLKATGQQLMRYGGKVVTEHPDSKKKFLGAQIPFFEEAKLLVEQVAKALPNKIVGWDIAISSAGPVVIEGNDNNSFFMTDIAYGGFLNHPLIPKLVHEA